ncbi:MAG: hypothetical protein JNM75_06160, partial [Rhodospirillales bacterium]|nr:hypothetical protein [Rhodospirillales bacterium]
MGIYTGTAGHDTIVPNEVSAGVTADPPGSKPSDGDDQIYGMGGNDYLDGGTGGDTISGGVGDDGILDNYPEDGYGNGPNSGNLIHGDAGIDYIEITITDTGGANPVTNSAWGDAGGDSVYLVYRQAGASQSKWIGDRPSGTITLYGGAGKDHVGVEGVFLDLSTLDLSATKVLLYGGADRDFLQASSFYPHDDNIPYPGNNADYLYGGPGNDTYFTFDSKDAAIEKAGEGHDDVSAINTDYALGPNIEDLSFSLFGPTRPSGFHGTGNALDNVILGSGLNDTLDGLGGNDTISGHGNGGPSYGGMGDADIIHGGAGNDLLYGGFGSDPAVQDYPDGADKLYGDDGNDRIYGQVGDDILYGGAGNDSLAGQEDNDTLWGGAGNDHLGGGTGNDLLYGEEGVDVITGRYDADTLSGGGGNDRFVYEDIADSKPGAANHDTILDFAGAGAAVGDRIDLHQIDADATTAGNQAFVFVSPTAVLKAGQLHVVAGGGTDSLVQGEVDGKAGVDFEI